MKKCMVNVLRFLFLFTLVFIAINFNNRVYADYYKTVEWGVFDAGGQNLRPENYTEDIVYFKNLNMLKADGIVVNNTSMQLNLYVDKFYNRLNILNLDTCERLTKDSFCKIKVFDDIGQLGEATFNMYAYRYSEYDEPTGGDQYLPFDYATGINVYFTRNVSGQLKFSLDYTWSGYGEKSREMNDDGDLEWYKCTGQMTATTSTPLIELTDKSFALDQKIINYVNDKISYDYESSLPRSSFITPQYTSSTLSSNKAYILSPTGYIHLFSYDNTAGMMAVYELDNYGTTCLRKYMISDFPSQSYQIFHIFYVPNSTDVLIAAKYRSSSKFRVYSMLLKWDSTTKQYYIDTSSIDRIINGDSDEITSCKALSKIGFYIKDGDISHIYIPNRNYMKYIWDTDLNERFDFYIGEHAYWIAYDDRNSILTPEFYDWVKLSDREKWSQQQYRYSELPNKEQTGAIATIKKFAGYVNSEKTYESTAITYFTNRSGVYIYVNSFGEAFYDIANCDRGIDDEGENVSQYPSFSIISPAKNKLIGNNSIFVPSIKVSDLNGDNLTCKYYIDSNLVESDVHIASNTKTPQNLSFNAIDISSLSEGEHTITFEVSDGICGAITESITFKIDKNGPSIITFNISSTTSTVTINATATDSMSGIHSTPYKYTIGSSISSGWTSDTSYTGGGSLMPNTLYLVKIEAKDILENISYQEKSLYTKAQTPYLSANTSGENSMNITVSDSNPFYTQYQIMFNDMYVAQNGVLTYTPAWITINGKSMPVTGLTQNTSYLIKAKARNNENIETEYTSEITGITLASPPGNITLTPSQTSVILKWDAVSNALSYNLEINGVVNIGITGTSYTHTGLIAETTQSYRISANTAIGTGGWGNFYTVTTYPYPPTTPTNLKTDDVKQTYVKLSWDPIIKASQYILEVNGTIVGTYTTTSALHEKLQPDTEYKYRIKAKNIGGESAWSDYVSVTTLPNPPETPKNITVRNTNTSVDVTWSSSERAEEYYVKFNGLISSTGNLTEYINENLTALTKCTFQVKAHNRGGDSAWSEVFEFTTNPDKPVTPSNIMVTAEKTSATLTWYLVPYAEKYDVEIYSAKTGSTVVKTTEDLSLRNAGLLPGTTYTLRVSARNVTGSSEWSEALIINTLPENDEVNTSITNVIAVVTNTYITLAWDDVDTDAEYVIEVDGVLQDIGKDRVYNHTGLSANEYHTYKVKAKTKSNQEYWCAVLSLSTLPDMPDAPAGIEATAYDNMIELKWVKSLDNVTYDIEVDGDTIDNGQNTTYDHQNLTPGTEHTYRVRAKNVTGVTAWSPAITQSTSLPEYIVECSKDETFDFSILASNVQDFTGVKFVITYNPDELEIEDLSSFTPDKEVTANGKIDGTKLNITMEAGKIIITVTDNIVPGTSWSGELNNIIFRAKINGESKINIKIE